MPLGEHTKKNVNGLKPQMEKSHDSGDDDDDDNNDKTMMTTTMRSTMQAMKKLIELWILKGTGIFEYLSSLLEDSSCVKGKMRINNDHTCES